MTTCSAERGRPMGSAVNASVRNGCSVTVDLVMYVWQTLHQPPPFLEGSNSGSVEILSSLFFVLVHFSLCSDQQKDDFVAVYMREE